MRITVNGVQCYSEGNIVSYEEVCELAGQPLSATVTYYGVKKGDSQRSGVLYAGKQIVVEDGMVFNCVTTGNA